MTTGARLYSGGIASLAFVRLAHDRRLVLILGLFVLVLLLFLVIVVGVPRGLDGEGIVDRRGEHIWDHGVVLLEHVVLLEYVVLNLRLRTPQGKKISVAAEAEAPGVGPPEMT
jgi:hypothetical protein